MIMNDKYNTMKFTDVWDDSSDFEAEYLSSPLAIDGFTIHHGETVGSVTYPNNLEVLYALLYSRYGNSPIANRDVNQFKFKVFSIMFEFGPNWEKELEINKKLRGLTEAEIMQGAKAIYNHAYNDGTSPSTGTTDELDYINDQNTSINKKSKMAAYADLLVLLRSGASEYFLSQFRRLFTVAVMPQIGFRIFNDLDDEEGDN